MFCNRLKKTVGVYFGRLYYERLLSKFNETIFEIISYKFFDNLELNGVILFVLNFIFHFQLSLKWENSVIRSCKIVL